MSVTLTVNHAIEHGEYVQEFGTILFDSTYPSGGEIIDATGDLGYFAMSFGGPSTTGYVPKFIASSQKVKLWYGDNNNASDGPLIESATTDLSAETVDFIGWRVK